MDEAEKAALILETTERMQQLDVRVSAMEWAIKLCLVRATGRDPRIPDELEAVAADIARGGGAR